MEIKEFVFGQINELNNSGFLLNDTPKVMVQHILSSLHKRYEGKDSLHDVQFTIIDDNIKSVHKANRLYLSKFSPVFNTMFTGQMREALVPAENLLNIDIVDIKSYVFSIFLNCIYNPCKVLSLPTITINDAEFLLDLLYAVKKYMCDDIRIILIYKIYKEMTVKNAYFYYTQRHIFPEISERKCWMVLTCDAYSFIQGETFLQMSAEDVLKYFKNINIKASELNLLKAIIKWAHNKIEDKSSDDQLLQVKQIIGVDIIKAIKYPKKQVQEFFDLIKKYKLPYEQVKKKERLVDFYEPVEKWIESISINDPNSENVWIFAIYEKLRKDITIFSDCVQFSFRGNHTIKGFLFATKYVSPKLNVQVFIKDEKILDESDLLSSIEKPWDKPCALYRFANPINIDTETEFSIQIKTSLILNYRVIAFNKKQTFSESILPMWDKKIHAIWGLLTTYRPSIFDFVT